MTGVCGVIGPACGVDTANVTILSESDHVIEAISVGSISDLVFIKICVVSCASGKQKKACVTSKLPPYKVGYSAVNQSNSYVPKEHSRTLGMGKPFSVSTL